MAAPLTDLTRKNMPIKPPWTNDCERAFSTLKRLLCSEPILRSPDFQREFILQTDAFERGIGAVRDDAGIERPVAFYSRKFLPRETRYSTVDTLSVCISWEGGSASRPTIGRWNGWTASKITILNSQDGAWLYSLTTTLSTIELGQPMAMPMASLSRAFSDDPATSSPEKEGGM